MVAGLCTLILSSSFVCPFAWLLIHTFFSGLLSYCDKSSFGRMEKMGTGLVSVY